jgi:hypothetical protein
MNSTWLLEQIEKEIQRRRQYVFEAQTSGVSGGERRVEAVYTEFEYVVGVSQKTLTLICRLYKTVDDVPGLVREDLVTIASALGMTLDDLRRAVDDE